MANSKQRQLLVLTLILLLGAAGRIVNIDLRSLWVDEGYAWYHANSPDLALSLARDTHPPLYFAALRVWELVAGESEIGLRMFSVLPSMVSIAMTVLLAKEFVRARGSDPQTSPAPALAALMMALADAENFMSQEVRHYTWHVLFAICSMYFFLRWIRTQRQRALLAWIAFTALLVYTHFIGAFTGIVEGLYALVFLRGQARLRAIGALAASVLLLSPWLLLVGARQVVNRGAGWAFEADSYLIGEFAERFFTRQWPLMVGLALFGAVTVAYTASGWRLKWRPHAPAVLLVMWVLVPVALLFAVNLLGIPILSTRRITQIAPPLALLFAFGLGNFRSPARAFLVAVVTLYGVVYLDFNRYDPDWRAVAHLTTDYAVPGDLVLSDVGGGDYQLLYYYDQLLPPGVTVRSLKVWRDFEPETYWELGQLIDQYDSVWLMRWTDDAQVFGWLHDTGHVQTALYEIKHIDSVLSVYRFDRLPDEPAASYGNAMLLRKVAIYPDSLRVDLWWSSDSPQTLDFTTSAFLLDETGKLVAQCDSFPMLGQRPTTGWKRGDVIYDPKPLVVTGVQSDGLCRPQAGNELPPGRYAVGVQVYTLDNGVRAPTLDGEPWAVVRYIEK